MNLNTFTKYTKYTVKELECYVANPDTCVEKKCWIDIISVLPKYLNNIGDGVKHYLSKKIGTYDRKIDGVVLAFKNTKILSPLMAIRPNSARIHMKVSTDFYVFKPVNGSVIEGSVQYVSKNYLSAVIYRVFNVSIKLQSQKLMNINRGSEIKFIVKSYDMKSDLPYIEGELLERFNGIGCNKQPNCIDINNASNNDTTIKREKVSDSCTDNCEVVALKSIDKQPTCNATKIKTEEKKHKSKKLMSSSNSNDTLLIDNDMENSIATILKSVEKEISDTDLSPLQEQGDQEEVTSVRLNASKHAASKKKRNSTRCNIELIKETLLKEFASHHESTENVEGKSSSYPEIAGKKTKKRQKNLPTNQIDDFEASIMSSLLRAAAEADKEAKINKKESRKSVRFDDTITEASFSTIDSSELMEISYSKSQGLSSSLKNGL